MKTETRQVLKIGCLITIVGIIIQAPIPAAAPVPVPDEGAIEFRRAERADIVSTNITDFITKEFRGVKYRVAESAELIVRRKELTEVIVRETELGHFGIGVAVDRSLWPAIKSMTTVSLGRHLAIFVEGNLIFVGVIQSPIPDGRLFMFFGRRSKEEVLEIAKRFSNSPAFMPLEGTSGK